MQESVGNYLTMRIMPALLAVGLLLSAASPIWRTTPAGNFNALFHEPALNTD